MKRHPVEKMRIAHLIALHNLGGVEVNYADFIGYPHHPPGIEHHTVTARKAVAPEIADKISRGSSSIAHAQLLANTWFMPDRFRYARTWNQHRLLRDLKPDTIILWNRLTNFRRERLGPSARQVIYYEHSRAWLTERHDEEKAILNATDKILCVSHAAGRVLQLKYDPGDDKPVCLCRSAVRPGCRFASRPKPAPDGRIRLGFAGRLVGIKGLASLIHAVRALLRSDFPTHLAVLGRGPQEGELRRLVEALQLSSHVTFLGYHSDPAWFYDVIDCLVAPSIRDCFPLVCLEALAAACPLVTSDIDGFPEINRHGQTGYTVTPSLGPRDYEQLGGSINDWPEFVFSPVLDRLVPPRAVEPIALAHAIQELFADTDRYRRFSHAALHLAKQDFQYPDFIHRFYQILNR